MEIILHCENWYINGYVIEYDADIDYCNVYEEDNETGMPVFGSGSFEKCLAWCYNN